LTLLSCRSNTALKTSIFIDRDKITIRQLSFYCPSLKNTPGDTPVYKLDSGESGAKLLIVAGTHGNEIAGIKAAEFFIKNVRVERGSVFVIPYLNKSGITGGNRLVLLKHQELPDPGLYIPPEGLSEYPGVEQRNINRSYPGTEHAGLAQKIAFAVMRLLINEQIDIAIDLHEAQPGSDLAWSIVANPKNVHIAALAVIDLDEKSIPMHLDKSPSNMDGLSHKEWGDRTGALSFLIETVNPAQASIPSRDKIRDPKYALERRVAIQLETIRLLVERCNEELNSPLVYSGIPEYSE